jgi:hypothetical protein
VREAADESLRRNEKTHLEVDQGDKAEEAWKRTLLGWGSKADVVNLTGCGEGTVAKMRRAARWHQNQVTGAERTPMGEKLYAAFGRDLRVHSWSKVNGVLLDLTPTQWDKNDAAAKLARNLVLGPQRLTPLLVVALGVVQEAGPGAYLCTLARHWLLAEPPEAH